MANRILSVGDHGRAERLSKFLDNVTVIPSSRGFKTFTGLYRGVRSTFLSLCLSLSSEDINNARKCVGGRLQVPVSIIATGMGIPMMDFVVRETRCIDIVYFSSAYMRRKLCYSCLCRRAIVDGEMAMIR